MKRTFKYRVKLSKSTEERCNQVLEQCQILYNLALEQRIMIYKSSKKNISFYDQKDQLPEFKETFSQFKQVNAQCLQEVLDRLDKAFKNFFRGCKQKSKKIGFPRFKSIVRYNSFTLSQNGWKLKGRYLHLSKIGKLKLYLSRPIEGKIKTVTIKRTSTGKWFVLFSCDNVLAKQFPQTSKEIGIDVGISSFLTDSEGKKVYNPLFLKKSLSKLRVRQKRLFRRLKGSQNRKDARFQVAKTYEKISNQRDDFLHKTANYYIQNYDKIYIEDLDINKMTKNKYFSRNISDSSWGSFFYILNYKAEEADRTVVKVDPRNTSQRCSSCGKDVLKDLSVRIHSCKHCGLILDRDHNAALNIKLVGQSSRTLTQNASSSYVVRESQLVI